MEDTSSFPLVIHIVTIPLTAAIGFFLGWIFRGAAERRKGGRPVRPGGAA
jgi:hypothetical protein